MIARLAERKCRPYKLFVSSKREIENISLNCSKLSGRAVFGAARAEREWATGRDGEIFPARSFTDGEETTISIVPLGTEPFSCPIFQARNAFSSA